METQVSSLLKDQLVLFATVSTGMVHHKFNESCQGMIAHFIMHGLPGRRTGLMPMDIRGSMINNERCDAVKQMLKIKQCSHLLFIDSDQSFPKDTLSRLMGWDKDIVACNIATKKIPSWPTARLWPEDREDEDAWANAPVVYTTREKQGLEEVARVGCGVMLIKREVFLKTGLNVFEQPWREKWQRYQGEDWSLCAAAERAGFKIYVDHGLSQHIGHWGEFNYTHDYVQEVISSEPPSGQAESEEHQDT